MTVWMRIDAWSSEEETWFCHLKSFWCDNNFEVLICGGLILIYGHDLVCI